VVVAVTRLELGLRLGIGLGVKGLRSGIGIGLQGYRVTGLKG
jgi:hypothetical protein